MEGVVIPPFLTLLHVFPTSPADYFLVTYVDKTH